LRQSGYFYFDTTVVSGDSGCGVFSDGRLIGVVSGGCFWLEENPQETWPVRVGRLEKVKESLEVLRKGKK
jgi:hypothetical protein